MLSFTDQSFSANYATHITVYSNRRKKETAVSVSDLAVSSNRIRFQSLLVLMLTTGIFLASFCERTPDAFAALFLLAHQISDREEQYDSQRYDCNDCCQIHIAASFCKSYSITGSAFAKARFSGSVQYLCKLLRSLVQTVACIEVRVDLSGDHNHNEYHNQYRDHSRYKACCKMPFRDERADLIDQECYCIAGAQLKSDCTP